MCLSNVYFDSKTGQEEVMREVARMEAQDDGFLLVGLLGEEKFIQGKIKSVDFINENAVVLEKTAA